MRLTSCIEKGYFLYMFDLNQPIQKIGSYQNHSNKGELENQRKRANIAKMSQVSPHGIGIY